MDQFFMPSVTTYAPGAYGSIYEAPNISAASPFPDTYVPPVDDSAARLDALSKAGFALGRAGRDIGEYRQNKALGKEAALIARRAAFQKTMAGLKQASAVRAVAGAQGRTTAGSPLLAELSSIQQASNDARNEIYKGNIAQFQANTRAKKSLYSAGGSILEMLLQGASIFKEK